MLRFLKYTLMAGVPFGLGMGAFFALRSGNLTTGGVLGLLCGALFGLIIAVFAETAHRKMQSRSGIFEGEPVIREGPANHFLRRESRGGWLTLTPTRLAFRSHGMNIQNGQLDIALRDIEAAQASMTASIVPNGLRVTRTDGVVESFVVSGRKDWARAISQAVARTQNSRAQSAPGSPATTL
jgi:hypothetical protein